MIERVRVDVTKIPIPRVRVQPLGYSLREWRELSMGQQIQALRLVDHHARNVEFVHPEDYARFVLHWQVDSQGQIIGWKSGHLHTLKDLKE